MEGAAGAPRFRVIACGKPSLGQMGLVEVIGRTRAAHPGRHPSRGERIRQHVRPAPCDAEGEQHVVELGVRIGLAAVPAMPGGAKVWSQVSWTEGGSRMMLARMNGRAAIASRGSNWHSPWPVRAHECRSGEMRPVPKPAIRSTGSPGQIRSVQEARRWVKGAIARPKGC